MAACMTDKRAVLPDSVILKGTNIAIRRTSSWEIWSRIAHDSLDERVIIWDLANYKQTQVFSDAALDARSLDAKPSHAGSFNEPRFALISSIM